jgi:hypothetical protein
MSHATERVVGFSRVPGAAIWAVALGILSSGCSDRAAEPKHAPAAESSGMTSSATNPADVKPRERGRVSPPWHYLRHMQLVSA